MASLASEEDCAIGPGGKATATSRGIRAFGKKCPVVNVNVTKMVCGQKRFRPGGGPLRAGGGPGGGAGDEYDRPGDGTEGQKSGAARQSCKIQG